MELVGKEVTVELKNDLAIRGPFTLICQIKIAQKSSGRGWDSLLFSSKLQELDAMKKRLKEIEKEAVQRFEIRKHDWREQGPLLKARINTKLSCCQAAIGVQVKIILSLDSDGKASKDASRRALALLLEVVEACIVSPWRKLRITEELFSVLLTGISQMTVCRGGQLLRVLLIPLKPLVQSTCAQADTMGNNQGSMFDSVTRLSCEIIEFGWSKDKSLVDTFIMGLAACIRERKE